MSVKPDRNDRRAFDERPSAATHTLWREVDTQYESGEFAEVVECLHRLIASGDVLAKVHLGWMMLHGIGMLRDEEKALSNYRSALDEGEVEAAIALAQYFSSREQWSTARAHYLAAAEMGSLVAAYRLGTCLELDSSGDTSTSTMWLEKAAIGGHVWSVAKLAQRQWKSNTWRGRIAAVGGRLRATALVAKGLWQARKDHWRFHPQLRSSLRHGVARQTR